MAVIASAAATLLHEGVGHGVTAWLRDDIPIELTNNHLSSLRPDKWVDAGGTLVNLGVGAIAILLSRSIGNKGNARYFFWILAALNLLPGAGYFLFSGVLGFGDWQEIIRDIPRYYFLRVAMVIFGAALYVYIVRLLARAAKPFCPEHSTYNTIGRLPYYAACLFSCVAGILDPLGLKLFLVSTVPAAFGGSSGLMWADRFLPEEETADRLIVRRGTGWWIAATVLGLAYVAIVGRGIPFQR